MSKSTFYSQIMMSIGILFVWTTVWGVQIYFVLTGGSIFIEELPWVEGFSFFPVRKATFEEAPIRVGIQFGLYLCLIILGFIIYYEHLVHLFKNRNP